jgi:hypothetical protein
VGRFSLWELCERNLEGGLPYRRPWRIGRKGSGDCHLFPQGLRWGTWKGAHLPGNLKDGVSRNTAFLSEEAQCGEPLGRAPVLGTLEDMLRAPDTGISLHRGPFMSEGTCNKEGGSYTGDFELRMEGSRNGAFFS